MPAEQDDAALCEACQRGDARAWEALVQRYSALAYSVPRRYRLPSSDCDDVHQATFMALVTALGRGERIERVGPWLATVAHRESWRVGRARNRALAMADFDSVAEPTADTLRDVTEEQAVREGLERLGTPCRELLTALFSTPGEPHYPTIAASLGMPVGSVGPTRARCLGKLEKFLRERGICGDAARTDSERAP